MKRVLVSLTALSLAFGTVPVNFARAQSHHEDHGPSHPEWHKGAHIQQEDWNRGQHVDYHAHHLRTPPHGYEWRQVDGKYVLAAAATGLIASVIIAATSH
jgi:Ni/Co efflux regulator RcnB